jgi:hypothetical protein
MDDGMNSDSNPKSVVSEMANVITGIPILSTILKAVGIGKRLHSILSPSGIYKVLSYESTLELLDIKGENASFSKREKVSYLQNNVIAYQDQAWGDGEILLNYRSTPGKPVDMYRPGRKTTILISIQNIRQFGDQDEFQIEWEMKNSFLRNSELWETSVDHPTQRIRTNIIFPAARPPLRVALIEDSLHKSTPVEDENINKMTDGRWMVHWETSKPRLNERYILQWDW